MMGAGKPSDTQSNFQSRTDFLTTRSILRGVMVGPDGCFRGSFCPVASILTFVPPRSITRTLGDFAACAVFIAWSLRSHRAMARETADSESQTLPSQPSCLRRLYLIRTSARQVASADGRQMTNARHILYIRLHYFISKIASH